MNYREIIRNSVFYKSIDNFAKDIFPELKRILSGKLNIICQEQNLFKPLTFIGLFRVNTLKKHITI